MSKKNQKSDKAKDQKKNQKPEPRLSNEALMLKLVKAKAGKKKVEEEFRPRYKDADEDFFQKRIKIYRRIAENAIKAEKEEVAK